jgi:ABC-2 type transport system ATP-binding protein
MMQRLGIAQALIHNPDFIMLDEPTDGVDPIGRKEIRNIISNLKNDGKTILINSHLLSEVEMICDEIGILNNGELIKKGKTSEFLQKSTSFSIEINQDSSEINLPSSEFDLSFLGKIVKLNTQSTEKLNEFIDWLRKNSIQIISISHEKYNLEDYFIKVIDGEENAK